MDPLLKDISHHLEWLKGVKESHGSVETSSLSQAEAINTKGIYTVGNIDYNAKDTPESVIRLLVQGDDSLMEEMRMKLPVKIRITISIC
ncbi:E3 ubiquitin-protein ligase RNF213-like [Saccoglossus kowalevskii]